jgi:hypothetical protein
MAHGVAEAVEKACRRHDVFGAYQTAIESHREATGSTKALKTMGSIRKPYGSLRKTIGKRGEAT